MKRGVHALSSKCHVLFSLGVTQQAAQPSQPGSPSPLGLTPSDLLGPCPFRDMVLLLSY